MIPSEKCKFCKHAQYEDLGYNPFPWMEGKAYQLICPFNICKYDPIESTESALEWPEDNFMDDESLQP